MALCALLGESCSWTPRQREQFFLELTRVSTVSVIQTVICGRIEKQHTMSGGYFDVPRRSCQGRQLRNGNLVFSFAGSGQFSKLGGLATGQFEQAVEAEYEVHVEGGYFYVVPVRVDLSRPRVFNLSLLAGAAESFFGTVSSNVRAAISSNLETPRTIITGLQGHTCVLMGWIPPRSIPIECEGSRPGEMFYPVGGSVQPIPRAPDGWAASSPNLTDVLAPPAEPVVLSEAELAPSPPEPIPAANVAASEPPPMPTPVLDTPSAPPRRPLGERRDETRRRLREYFVENGDGVAARAVLLLHPDARLVKLKVFEIEPRESSFVVQLRAAWISDSGSHEAHLLWEIAPTAHMRVAVLADDDQETTAADSAERLESWFRDTEFGALPQN